jgi:hypothetical protein
VRRHLLVIIVASAVLGISIPVAEARPRATPSPASCTVSGSVVDASGLPTDQVINFLVTDNAGTWGWVLGFTTDGAWSVSVPGQNGPTTYQLVSRTRGPNGTHYTVFAACS